MAETLLQFKDIVKSFGKNQVLTGVSFDIPYKERFGIIGVSGSGKTTLLNILIGFLRANSGGIYYRSENILRRKKDVQQTFGFAAQDGSFYQKLTVMENVSYFGRLYGMKKDDIEKRAVNLLGLVGLSRAKNVLGGNLSKGMQRRLDIACAMIHNPRVLILDEPTEDLDPLLRKDILALIEKINEQGTTIIMTSHLLQEIEAICTRIAILHKGVILETGTSKQLREKYYKYDEIHFETTPGDYKKVVAKLNKKHIHEILHLHDKVIIHTPEPEAVLKNILLAVNGAKEKLSELSLSKPTLEEVFEKLTKEG